MPFVGLSIPTILFGLGMIGHLSPFIEAFVETKHTAPTMADCWKTVPNVVAGKCLEQINKSGIWRQKKCCRVDSPAMVPNPLDHFYHTQMSSCNMFHSIGITSIPITPGSTRVSYAPVAPAAAASYPSERCSDHGRPGSSDSTAVVTRGQWLIYKQIK